MSATAIIILVLLGVLLVYVIGVHNRLVELKNRFENAFAQIEVQLKRRYDLIPNLVETAKGYLQHERETLEAVIAARNQAMQGLTQASVLVGDAKAMELLGQAENTLLGALGRMNMVMEAYPELKADSNLRQLSEELASTENRVAFARQAYNDAVMFYNTYRQSFPPVFFAARFGHDENASLLSFEDSKQLQQSPKVSF